MRDFFILKRAIIGGVMKLIHYLSIVIIILLIGFGMYDEYHVYASNGVRVKSYETDKIVRVYVKGDRMIQIVHTMAYHDNMIFYVSIERGVITDFKVISHEETEDYGGYIEEAWFEERMKVPCYDSLELVKLSKEEDNEIVAITGATITTRGIVEGVNDCIRNYWRYLDDV